MLLFIHYFECNLFILDTDCILHMALIISYHLGGVKFEVKLHLELCEKTEYHCSGYECVSFLLAYARDGEVN
jgi:hypothetical protein